MRYSIKLSYDGSSFCGWQVQPNATTVQECLEKALSTLLKRGISVVGAGRTDSKVNAIGYVAHFDFEDAIDTARLGCKLNAILPKSIVVHSVNPVPDDFHARFGATKREYTYFLHRKKDPFVAGYSYFWPYSLDVEAMNDAAKALLGTHDFSCFEKLGSDNKSSVCTVFEARWTFYTPTHAELMGFGGAGASGEGDGGGEGELRPASCAGARGSADSEDGTCGAGASGFGQTGSSDSFGDAVGGTSATLESSGIPPKAAGAEGAYLYFRISADRFLRNMVRAVVGSLLDVGRGRRTKEEFAALVLEAPADNAAPGASTAVQPDIAEQMGGAEQLGTPEKPNTAEQPDPAEKLGRAEQPEPAEKLGRAKNRGTASVRSSARTSCLRSLAGESVPGHALFLSKVEY